uniref:Sulfotransferase n=1 Tax=Oryza nivara TaxID=4536 RepID=A0A0E0I3G9_ORYNI
MQPTSAAAGPVPFKDIAAVAVARRPVAEEYGDVVAALPSRLYPPQQRWREYQGTWFREAWVPGIVALQRRFEPRAGDVLLASLPKCGTTWLKALALAFATAARGVYPPAAAGGDGRHPLLRLNPHECVPFLEGIYLDGEEAKLDAAPTPRLMSTHASYPNLPASITEDDRCKIIYICRAARRSSPPRLTVSGFNSCSWSHGTNIPSTAALYLGGEWGRLSTDRSRFRPPANVPVRANSDHDWRSTTAMWPSPRRQPKDMAISLWHFMNCSKAKTSSLSDDQWESITMLLSDVWESIREGAYLGGPIWEHILGYWNTSKAKPDKVLFLKYEEVLHDPTKNIEKIAEFIGQPFSDAEKEAGIVESIIELCSFEKMKAFGTGSLHMMANEYPHESFFRKGVIGDWVNHVTPEMADSLDKFLSAKFYGSGFTFAE